MAQRTFVQHTDDLDGTSTDGVKNVRFAVAGVEYEIDLNPAHQEDFGLALAPYLAAARKTGPTRVTARRSGGKQSDNTELRNWARAQGFPVPERGRISKQIREAYEAATGGSRADTSTAPGSGNPA